MEQRFRIASLGCSPEPPGGRRCEVGQCCVEGEIAVVHHSDSPNSCNARQVPSFCEGPGVHMDGRGWDDIGYNFVVDKYGNIWEKRRWRRQSGRWSSRYGFQHTGTVGVMVLGTYTATAPTKASVESVARHRLEDGYQQDQQQSVNHFGGGPKCPAVR
ncbi:MAG: N-acetylmuramoyl-L-alanine amidase [Microthrixaceae bacterium]